MGVYSRLSYCSYLMCSYKWILLRLWSMSVSSPVVVSPFSQKATSLLSSSSFRIDWSVCLKKTRRGHDSLAAIGKQRHTEMQRNKRLSTFIRSHMSAHMHVCTNICMYVCMHMRMYAWMYEYVNVCRTTETARETEGHRDRHIYRQAGRGRPTLTGSYLALSDRETLRQTHTHSARQAGKQMNESCILVFVRLSTQRWSSSVGCGDRAKCLVYCAMTQSNSLINKAFTQTPSVPASFHVSFIRTEWMTDR